MCCLINRNVIIKTDCTQTQYKRNTGYCSHIVEHEQMNSGSDYKTVANG